MYGLNSSYDRTLETFASKTKDARFESGAVLTHGKVFVPSGHSQIVFDAVRATRYRFHTRVRAEFHNTRRFKFSLRRKLSENLLDDLKKITGLQLLAPLPMNHPGWPRNLELRANDASRASQLFASERIRQCVQAQPTMQLDVRSNSAMNSPLGAAKTAASHVLHFRAEEWICDMRRLQFLHVLFDDLLAQLAK